MVVKTAEVAGLWGIPTVLGPWMEPIANAGLVVVLVIFMLLERSELRNRAIKLFGYGTLAVTTRAFDEAGSRVSRYLFRQSLLNAHLRRRSRRRTLPDRRAVCGAVGVLAAAFRYVPFVGPWIAASCRWW